MGYGDAYKMHIHSLLYKIKSIYKIFFAKSPSLPVGKGHNEDRIYDFYMKGSRE